MSNGRHCFTVKRIARRYVATWHINVGSVPPGDVPDYMEAVKANLSDSHEDPFDELRETLEAPVAGFWIPSRTSHTHLEIQEFTFEVEEEYEDNEEI